MPVWDVNARTPRIYDPTNKPPQADEVKLTLEEEAKIINGSSPGVSLTQCIITHINCLIHIEFNQVSLIFHIIN